MGWLINPSFFFICTNLIYFSKYQLHSGVSSLRPNSFFKNDDMFRYNSKERRNFKLLKNYNKYVEDHHCIPKQFKNHTLLKILNFDINNSKNIYIMPNKKGKSILNLHPDTLVHQGYHYKYNMFVKEHLDYILLKPEYDEKKYEFWLFFNHLKDNLQFNNNIPWK